MLKQQQILENWNAINLIICNAHFGISRKRSIIYFWGRSLHDFFHQGDLLSFSTVLPLFIDHTFQLTFSKRRFCLCSANRWFWNPVLVSGYWLLLKPNFSKLHFLHLTWFCTNCEQAAFGRSGTYLIHLHWLSHTIPAAEMLQK